MAFANSIDMASKSNICECKKGVTCSKCSSSSIGDLGNPGDRVKELLVKIQSLIGQMANLSRFIKLQNEKITKLECIVTGASESVAEHKSVNSRKKANKKRKVRKEDLKNKDVSELSDQSENSVLDDRLNCNAVGKRTVDNHKQHLVFGLGFQF